MRRLLVIPACLLALVATGCSSEPEPFAGRDIAPTASPSVTVTPTPAPVGNRVVRGDGYELAVPGEWEEKLRTLEGIGEVARWSEPARSGAPEVVVAVVTDRKPAEPLLEQSYRLEMRLRTEGVQVVRSTSVRTDVEDPAVLVQWEEGNRGQGKRRTVWQLFVQAPGKIINVVGYAPSEDFMTSEVPKVMGTFMVRS